MQRPFNPEYFILLDHSEMAELASAGNRDEFQPELKAFFYSAHRLEGLRLLSLPSKEHIWIPPRLYLNDKDEIIDDDGKIRGYRHLLPLPARPGEPQMALSYDWFWSEFSRYLIRYKIWGHTGATHLLSTSREEILDRIVDIWSSFWTELSSRTHLERSLGLFLDNKTLFKNQAKPWDSKDIPILSENMATYLIDYYRHGKSRRRHFKQGSIQNAIKDLEGVISDKRYATIPFPAIPEVVHIAGGDFNLQTRHIRCGACGEVIMKKEGHERLAIFLKDADERAQGAPDKDKRPRYCKRCVASVFLCPVKLAPETLTVRFMAPGLSPEILEEQLKKYVAQTLNVNAGNFISLHITDILNRKPLTNIWGAYHYALWKMAVTFPPELFAQKFIVEVYPGEERFTLPRWSLWFVSALAQWNNVFEYNSYRKFNTPFSRFLRLVSGKGIFHAFYTLISNDVIHPSYARSWKINALQEIWNGLETQLKEENMPIPDYPRIAGFAGLLLPLAERVQSSKKNDNEKKRAITKLLEEADKPIQYAYTAARESGSGDFIFCRRPRNRFFYDKALELLKEVGEDVEALQQEGDRIVNEREAFAWAKNAEAKIFISSDQIARAASALLNEGDKPYANEADWRAFAYQVKLALWSFFPMYLGSQEK